MDPCIMTCHLCYRLAMLVAWMDPRIMMTCILCYRLAVLVVWMDPCIMTCHLCYRLAVLVVWLAPCIMDRIKWSRPGVCKWEPSNNQEFVFFVAIVGHHIPCLILTFCYVKVAIAMSRRAKVRPWGAHIYHVENNVTMTDAMSEYPSAAPSNMKSLNPSTLETNLNTRTLSSRTRQVRKTDLQEDRERKTFVTLSYVIISYLICWVPFHIVFDFSAIDPSFVPESIYNTTFWLTYFNSTLNPFLYAYSSKEFRLAFKRVLKCAWKRRK